MQQTLLRALVALTTISALAGCGDDETSDFTLAISTDRDSLAGDGADTAAVTVSVLDNSFNPPPAASTVILNATDLTGAATGVINGEPGVPGTAVTDAQGFATFEFGCSAEGTATLIAIFPDGNAQATAVAQIECTPAPDGDWVISTIADRRFIGSGETTTLSITGQTGSGDPVPQGSTVVCSTESDLVTFSRGSSQVTLALNSLGRSSTVVVSGESSGTAQVCCGFEDTRFGDQNGCVSLVIGDAPETDTCIGTVSNVRAPADGRTVTSVTLNVSRADGTSVEASDITMIARSGTWVDGSGAPIAAAGNPIGGQTGSGGDFTARLQSPTIGGSADIDATATFTNSDGQSVTLECEFPEPLSFYGPPSCIFQGMTPEVIGIENSSLPENGTVTFCFEQGAGQPPAPSRVDFHWAVTIPGVELSATSATTDVSTGCVSVEINSGRTAGRVEIEATLDFSEESDSVCTSGPLPIRHARPTAEGWNFTCEMVNMPGLLFAAGDEVFTDFPMQCSSILRDRFNNPVNNPDVQVFFAAEQGTIVSPVSPDDNGRVVTIYNPNGGLPKDVAPLDAAGEPRVVSTLDGGVVNSRDAFVTLIAWTNGEEEFYDEDGNGNYDEGEVFVDLSEPYLDNNDNDSYDPAFPVSDRFFDVETEDNDLNGEFDDANGEWDANTAIWTRTGIVLYGPPAFGRIDDPPFNYGADFGNPGLSPQFFSHWVINNIPGTGIPEFRVSDADGAVVNFVIRDENMNAPNIDHVSCEFALTGCEIDIETIGTVVGTNGRNFTFTRDLRDLNSSGGNATGENVFRRLWSTNFAYEGTPSVICQGFIEKNQLDEETPSAECSLNTIVTYSASASGGGSATAGYNFVTGVRITP